MPTVTIEKLTELDALYCRLNGQEGVQDAYIQLDLETGIMSANYNGEIGNSIPFSVFHGRVRRWTIPVLTADAANQVMQDWAPTAQRILDGSTIEWDGNNHVAVLYADAHDADEMLGGAMNAGELDDLPGVDTIDADAWYSDLSRSEIVAQTGITGETTDTELDAIVAVQEAEAAACAEGGNVSIPDGFDEYLREIRDDLHDEDVETLLDTLKAVAEKVDTLNAERDRLTAQRDEIVRRLSVANVFASNIAPAAHLTPARVGQIVGDTKTLAAQTRTRIAAGLRWEPVGYHNLEGFAKLVEAVDNPQTVLVPLAGGEVVLLNAGPAYLTPTGIIIEQA